MPIGYLVTTTLVAWGVLSALAPLRKPLPLGVLSFLLGFVLNELPFVFFYWLVFSTLLAIAQTGVDSPVGWVAVALAALATIGLVPVVLRALRTGPVVDRALDEGLGEGWRNAVDVGMTARLTRGIPYARIVFAPFFFRRRDVERVTNLRYGDAGRANLLDLYRGRSHPSAGPVLIHLHGGALVMGRKSREARSLIYRLASEGWVCVSANYRLSPAARFPDHLIDVKKVIAWVRENGPGYGADPSLLFLVGSSSGAQLAALAALTPNDPRFQPGFEHADTDVTAAICMHGYYGSVDSGERYPSSPVAYVRTDAPPIFVIHGALDTVAPVEGARELAESLRGSSADPVLYAELPGGHHGFDRFHSLRFDTLVNSIEAFTAWVRSRERARRR